jgi:hypothetical protein
MKVSNVRMGFASNSSSTHFIIGMPSDKSVRNIAIYLYKNLKEYVEFLENRNLKDEVDLDEIHCDAAYDAKWGLELFGWEPGMDN